jgi:ferredoxin
MNLELDPTACTGRGMCADAAPEIVTLDEWGFPILIGAEQRPLTTLIRPSERKYAKRATKICPQLALKLQR